MLADVVECGATLKQHRLNVSRMYITKYIVWCTIQNISDRHSKSHDPDLHYVNDISTNYMTKIWVNDFENTRR